MHLKALLDLDAFQQAQRVKRDAAEQMRSGDHQRASQLLRDASVRLGQAAAGAPQDLSEDLLAEAQLLEQLAARAPHDDPRRLSKWVEHDRHYKDRKRGRRRP